MSNQLACVRSGMSKTHSIDHVVQTRFEEVQQVRAGYSPSLVGDFEIAAELTFENAINPFRLLFLAELQGIIGNFPHSALAMVSGWIIAFINRASGRQAALSLQHKFLPFTSAESAYWTSITCHGLILLVAGLDASPQTRAATVMWDWGDVFDHTNLHTRRLYRANSGLPA